MSVASERVLITGVAGFIGSHVAEAYLEQEASVLGVDNFDSFYHARLKERNLAEVQASAPSDRFDVVRADICDSDMMMQVFDQFRPTIVVHLAARAGVRPSIQQPVLYARVNVEGTSVLLEAARQFGNPRFLMASSSSVYGNNEKVPFAEADDVNNPISPYAATKRSCELVAHSFAHLYGLRVACLRFFTVIGPRQRPDLAVSKFLRLVAEDAAIPMFGDGSSSRDYTYVDDIVAGVLASGREIERFGYRIWNLGGNHPTTLREMIDTIGRVAGVEPRVDQQPMQPGDVERTYADLTRSGEELGYRPTTSFEEGVSRQWDWLKRQL